MKHEHSIDRAAIKVEIDHLHQIGDKADTSIGQGISRRIEQLERKLDSGTKPRESAERQRDSPRICNPAC